MRSALSPARASWRAKACPPAKGHPTRIRVDRMRPALALPVLLHLLVGERALPPTAAPPDPSSAAVAGVGYVDATRPAGLADFRQVSGGPAKDYVIEVTGSGAALMDYDADGWLDVYLVNGST